MSKLLIAMVSVLLATTSVWSQSSGTPTFVVGDSWQYSDGRQVKVVRVEDGITVLSGVYAECRECLYHVDQNNNPLKVTEADGKPVAFNRLPALFAGASWRYYDWPLELNKTWNFSAQGYTRGEFQNVRVSLKVAAHEDLKTKAGVFKAYRIERSWSMNWSGETGNSWTDTVWYSPDTKSLVKFKPSSRSTRPEWELVSYSVK